MEEKTGDLRKLHNIKFVVFHEDEMHSCIICKVEVGTSERKRRLDVMMTANQTEGLIWFRIRTKWFVTYVQAMQVVMGFRRATDTKK